MSEKEICTAHSTPTDTNITCELCKFGRFYPPDKTRRECYRFPAMAWLWDGKNIPEAGSEPEMAHPMVQSDDWCGEFTPRALAGKEALTL